MRFVVLVLIASCIDPPRTVEHACRTDESDRHAIGIVRDVKPVWETHDGKQGASHRLAGAALIVEPEGRSRESLQRSVECSRHTTGSPLAVESSSVVVKSAADAYRIEVISDDDESAREILRRAKTFE